MGRSNSRRVILGLAILVTFVLLLSGSALAEHVVLKDDFEGTEGQPPKASRWELVGLDANESVVTQQGTLGILGDVHARYNDTFETDRFVLTVDLAPRNLSGRPVDVKVWEEKKKNDIVEVVRLLAVTYNGTDGWTITYIHKEEEESHTSMESALEKDTWYTLELKVISEEFEVLVMERDNGTEVTLHEGEMDPFHGEGELELGAVGSEVSYDNLRMESHRWQDNPVASVSYGLFFIFFVVLLGPFLVKKIEHQLEAFLFTMGVIAVTLDTVLMDIVPSKHAGGHSLDPMWSSTLVEAGLADPIMITVAVLVAGLVFHYGRNKFKQLMEAALDKLSLEMFIFVIVVTLGLVASLITAIISALLLVEVISVLRLDRKTETDLTILTCFSIGLGAALTPVGEPLSTIVIITKLNEEFWYLAKQIGIYIVPSIVGLGVFSIFYIRRGRVSRRTLEEEEKEEKLQEVGVRAGKVYIFVMALVFLGTGFAPIIEWYIKKLGWQILYWVNTSSAILDNATLASAEIVPSMTSLQLDAALIALLISGGMLIPGNIPNIIAANKLTITSKEWARFGVPVGAVMLALFFVILIARAAAGG